MVEYKEILDDYEAKDLIKYHGEVSDTSEYLKFAHSAYCYFSYNNEVAIHDLITFI